MTHLEDIHMKKLIALVLALVLAFAAFGCSSGSTSTPEVPENATPAQKIIADFTAKAGSHGTLQDLADALMTEDNMPFALASMEVEPGYLNGFSAEIGGFKEGIMIGPMIGSIPFISYVFVLDEGADANAFVQTLKDNADLRWNICTAADEMAAGISGNMVCFVMSPANFEE